MTETELVVLMVEDSPDDIALMRRSFGRAAIPHRLHVVRRGREAMAWLEGREPFTDRDAHPLPDVVLLDLRLGDVPGHEVLAWIRNRPELGGLPVVVVTTSARPEDLEAARALGATDYFVKPLRFDELVAFTASLPQYCRPEA